MRRPSALTLSRPDRKTRVNIMLLPEQRSNLQSNKCFSFLEANSALRSCHEIIFNVTWRICFVLHVIIVQRRDITFVFTSRVLLLLNNVSCLCYIRRRMGQ